jgi:hypothetical protein
VENRSRALDGGPEQSLGLPADAQCSIPSAATSSEHLSPIWRSRVTRRWLSPGAHRICVQPPASQGVLLAMAPAAWERGGCGVGSDADNLGIEPTQVAFAFQDCVGRGSALLSASSSRSTGLAQAAAARGRHKTSSGTGHGPSASRPPVACPEDIAAIARSERLMARSAQSSGARRARWEAAHARLRRRRR